MASCRLIQIAKANNPAAAMAAIQIRFFLALTT